MSVIFNATGEGATRSTNIVQGGTNYTCTFYVKFTATPAGLDYQTLFASINGVGTYTEYVGIWRYVDGLRLFADSGGGSVFTAPFVAVEGVWYRIAYVRVGISHRLYVNGVLIDTVVMSMFLTTLSENWIGDDTFSVSGLEIAYFREWDVALSLTEINLEWVSPIPVEDNPSFLITDTPLASDLFDDSGHGNDWTAVGALTFDAANPAFPANATRATATVIGSLPFSTTQDVWSLGLAYEVWYQYTAVVGDDVIGVWGFGDNLTPYEVKPRVYIGADTDDILLETSNAALYRNKPTRFSVTLGETYYFQFTPEPTDPASALLHIEAETFIQQSAPVGSIVVNDDVDKTRFPLGIFSSVHGDDYHTLRYVNGIAAGEGGDVLLSGRSLLSDIQDGDLKLYSPSFVQLAAVALNIGSRRSLRTCHGQQLFYVGYGGNPCLVSTVDGAGAIGSTTWSMTGTATIAAIAANNDGTILYSSGTSAQPIRRWDLINDVALSNFLPTLAGYQAVDILVLADDTILISYQILTSSTGDFLVRRYDAAATLLNTYNFGVQETFGGLLRTPSRMAYALDDPNSFWVYLHLIAPDNGLSVFRNVKVSDGSTLAEVLQVEFNQGLYTATETLTPLTRFGNSLSCPFFISREEIGPPTPPPGTIIVSKVVVPPDATLFDFVTAGLIPGTFQLSHADSRTFLNLLAGSGYGVTEIPSASYTTVIVVSNGSPPSNITVAAGETVLVTFTNTFVPPPPAGGPGCPVDFPVDSASIGACAPPWTP